MATKIISGFPAIGKTYAARNSNFMCVDCDSSQWNWLTDPNGDFLKTDNGARIPNPAFPQNYIDHIKFQIKHDFLDFVFVSSHENVRECMQQNYIDFTIVIPALNCKKEYYKRMQQRESPQSLITLVMDNWDDWLIERQRESNCYVLNQGQTLIDILPLWKTP
jgi:hypothetical protein